MARKPDLLDRIAAYDVVALVLQGGGALGAYQCGVYEGLHTAGIAPTWFTGISIGAINAALIAGNPPEQRLPRLREFWETVTTPTLLWPGDLGNALLQRMPTTPALETGVAALSAMGALWQGRRGFFDPWPWPPLALADGSANATSFYDTAPLRATLERLVDFDLINADNPIRLTVGATDVETGNFEYFDSARMRIGPEHVMASGALPPAFAPVPIDGRWYWDGGIVSNTPLEHILDAWPRRDTLAFQVDLWSARGPRPRTLMDVLERAKDIQYSSRTRHGTDMVARTQQLRTALTDLIQRLPGKRLPDELSEAFAPWLDDRVFNIVHLIYQAKPHEEQFKDYAFNPLTMQAHWRAGLADTQRTLAHPEYFDLPDRARGYAVHDVHRRAQKSQLTRF